MFGSVGERCGDRFASTLTVPACELRQRHRGLHDQEIDLSGDQIGHRGPGAAIGDELHLLAGGLLEQDAGDVRRGVLVDEGDLAGIRLHPGDELLQVVRRQILLGDHQLRIDRDQPDRVEILLQVVVAACR